MNKQKGLFLAAVSLVLSVLLCLLLYSADNKYTHSSVQPINGVLYLSEQELTDIPIHYLIRQWEFYPNVLLSPSEVAVNEGYRRHLDIGGQGGMTHGSGTYRLTLMLPESTASYALELPEIFSAYCLFVDGKPMLQLGNPSPQHYTEGIAGRVVLFSGAGATELLLTVSDFSGVYSGMTYPPAFGTAHAVLQQREIRLLLHGSAILLSLVGMSLALAFGFRGNRRRGILYSSICLCLIGVVSYPLVHGLLTTGFQPWYTVEIGCYYGLLLLAVLLQCELYGLHGKKILLLVSPCVLGLLCAILRVGGAAFWSPAIGNAFSLLSLCLKYYAAACLIGLSGWALFREKPYSTPLMCASIALSVCLVCDRLLPLYEPIYFGWFGEVGGILIVFALGTTLWLDALEAYRFRLSYEDGYRQMERMMVIQKDHYQQLSQQIQRSRETEHDLRHHMRTLRDIASDGQVNHLIAYLDSYEPHLAERELTIWSDHPAADAVLGHYAATAKQLQVTYDVRFAIPPDLNFPDDELCILLGNLLENAMEALEKQKDGQHQLYLRGDFNNGRLRLIVDNSFDGVLKEHNGKYISTKHGGFGVGTSSVRAIAEKYGGLVDFSVENCTFHASVMIPIVETAKL